MKYTTDHTYDGMGEFLFRKWYDGEIEADDEFRDDEGRYGFAQFGRRVIVDEEGRRIDYTRHATIADACKQLDELHTHRPPTEYDNIVGEDRDGYYVSMEGVSVGTYQTRDAAELALARAMVDAGCFGDSFYVNERGNYHRIDEEIRALHDAGGDKMRADLVNVTPEEIDAREED